MLFVCSLKKENKEYEEFSEQEIQKKEAEIRKLKEEAILKDRTFKQQKTEMTQLQSEVAALKVTLESCRINSRVRMLNKSIHRFSTDFNRIIKA